jgi:hypothetical protein
MLRIIRQLLHPIAKLRCMHVMAKPNADAKSSCDNFVFPRMLLTLELWRRGARRAVVALAQLEVAASSCCLANERLLSRARHRAVTPAHGSRHRARTGCRQRCSSLPPSARSASCSVRSLRPAPARCNFRRAVEAPGRCSCPSPTKMMPANAGQSETVPLSGGGHTAAASAARFQPAPAKSKCFWRACFTPISTRLQSGEIAAPGCVENSASQLATLVICQRRQLHHSEALALRMSLERFVERGLKPLRCHAHLAGDGLGDGRHRHTTKRPVTGSAGARIDA